MFSIKVINEEGYEFVKSDVRTVTFNPPNGGRNASLFVWYQYEPAETFLEGKIYVMNEMGKTIANYEIFNIEPCGPTLK